MDRRAFVERCVLEKNMKPPEAIALWGEMNTALLADWKMNKSHPAEMLRSVYELFETMPAGSRKTLLALLKEHDDELTRGKR